MNSALFDALQKSNGSQGAPALQSQAPVAPPVAPPTGGNPLYHALMAANDQPQGATGATGAPPPPADEEMINKLKQVYGQGFGPK